ncbi:MAG TPA: HAD-IIIC family phosphatase [Bacteroidia bacterium]|nr:HAD-IIIC family phosphatase [Bacteroidia bacterium]
MKLLICSDITFDPVRKEILKSVPDFQIDLEYHEDLISALINTERFGKGYDFILLYTDQFFHQKPVSWQNQYLIQLNALADRHPSSRFIAGNCLTASYARLGLASRFSSEQEMLSLYNHGLEQLAQKDNFFFLDVKHILFAEGISNLYNFALGALYQMPYNKRMISLLASEILNFLRFLTNEEKKVIVVDCDNTLWKGIIGEDGLEGIECDRNAGGFVHYQFQSFLKQKKEEGFLLCICSKNNENEVKDAFDKKDMPLKWDDFVLKKVNWTEKNINISQIAKELNLGEDSFIFIDDNPFEIGTVKEFTRVNTLFTFENNYDKFLTLSQDYSFKRKKILAADLEKNQQYKIEIQRKQEESQAHSLEDYIRNLNLKIDIRENDIENIDRLAQMTEKTNQFNFNKIAYTKNDLLSWIKKGNFIYSCKVSDRFGDYGIVGLIMVEKQDDASAGMHNFLMSCRALGKRIEFDFYNFVLAQLRLKNLNLKGITFVETARNEPAKTFLKQLEHASHN